jgi:hypothetical protein
MSDNHAQSYKDAVKIEIRCNDVSTRRGFKKVAADFKTYEDVIKWVVQNYDLFVKLAPPYPIHGKIL